jgi:hypothetical protein
VHSFILAFALGSVGGPPCDAGACVCVRTGGPQSALGQSEAVFVGRAEEVEGADGSISSRSTDSLPYFLKSVTFAVERGWTGAPPDTVRASIDLAGPDCPTHFAPGQRYLVYAELRAGGYVIGVCTRTSPIESELARADLKILGPSRYQRP